MPDDLLYRDEAYRLIGACLAVHKDKGHGFVEAIYQDALEIELELSGIPFERQRNFSIYYRDRPLKPQNPKTPLSINNLHINHSIGESPSSQISTLILKLFIGSYRTFITS